MNFNIDLLEHQIELEESNYRYAVELKKDHNILRRMRDNIGVLKDILCSTIEKYKKVDTNDKSPA
jgi:hypothetical protein